MSEKRLIIWECPICGSLYFDHEVIFKTCNVCVDTQFENTIALNRWVFWGKEEAD